MRFFDSCVERVNLSDVSEDIASDLAFEKYLKTLHEQREREQICKEKDDHDKTSCDC